MHSLFALLFSLWALRNSAPTTSNNLTQICMLFNHVLDLPKMQVDEAVEAEKLNCQKAFKFLAFNFFLDVLTNMQNTNQMAIFF